MSDAGRELAELKREIVEARNQAIKTDNQVKNLTLDIKGFEKRFDGLEGRVRLSSIGVNLIVAITIALAAYAVSSVRIKSFEGELTSMRAAAKDEREATAAKSEDLHAKLAEVEKKRRSHDQASDVASQILTLLDNKQDQEASDLLDKLDVTQLTSLERKVTEKRFSDLRRRSADNAYRSGRNAVLANRFDAAVPDLRRALALDTEQRNVANVRYLLATALYSIKHYDEAEPLWRELTKSDDHGIVDEARYYLAAALAHLGRRDEAKNLFNQISSNTQRFSSQAKSYVAALESEGELPVDLPGGRVRISRKNTAQASDDTVSNQ